MKLPLPNLVARPHCSKRQVSQSPIQPNGLHFKDCFASLESLSEKAQDAFKPLVVQGKALQDMMGPAIEAGRDGAVISLALGALIYPLASLASYQRIHGCALPEAMKAIQKEGGIARSYRGILPTAIGVVLARFCAAAGDMAATKLLHEKAPEWKNPATCALLGGTLAVMLYCPLLPLETLANTARTTGGAGVQKLTQQVLKEGLKPLYSGAGEAIAESLIDHVAWYGARHALDTLIPQADGARDEFLRNCLIGALSGITSDCFSYPMNIVKTQKQVLQTPGSAFDIGKKIVNEKGVGELWRRGFAVSTGSHIISDSGYQGIMSLRGHTESSSNESSAP